MTIFVIRVFAIDEDDAVGACRVSLDVLEELGVVCSVTDTMTGRGEMESVVVVWGGADADRCTCSWGRCDSGVGEGPLNLFHFAWRVLRSGMLGKGYGAAMEG